LLSTGGVFYIVRSIGIFREKSQKLLETDVFYTKDALYKVKHLIGRKMELLEFKVATDAIKAGFEFDTILIDGSLYGRAVHLPIETKTKEEIPTLLEYFEVYKELLDLCHQKEILLVGVSKESRSTFFRDYLLKIIYDIALKESGLKTDEVRKLVPIFSEVLDDERAAFRKFDKLKTQTSDNLDRFELILNELSSSRPDYQIVMNNADTVGYTRPLLLGPSARVARFFERYISNPTGYVIEKFPRTVREKNKEFVDWASKVISNIPKLPSFISFHLLLHIRDSPLRIDLPNYQKMLHESGWPKPTEVDLKDLLKVMIAGYCGLDAYNLWLKNVDERVRLRRKVVDDIYFPYMEKLFGEKIIRGRGYRRVRYP